MEACLNTVLLNIPCLLVEAMMYEFFSSRNVNKNARDQVHVNDLAVLFDFSGSRQIA